MLGIIGKEFSRSLLMLIKCLFYTTYLNFQVSNLWDICIRELANTQHMTCGLLVSLGSQRDKLPCWNALSNWQRSRNTFRAGKSTWTIFPLFVVKTRGSSLRRWVSPVGTSEETVPLSDLHSKAGCSYCNVDCFGKH